MLMAGTGFTAVSSSAMVISCSKGTPRFQVCGSPAAGAWMVAVTEQAGSFRKASSSVARVRVALVWPAANRKKLRSPSPMMVARAAPVRQLPVSTTARSTRAMLGVPVAAPFTL